MKDLGQRSVLELEVHPDGGQAAVAEPALHVTLQDGGLAHLRLPQQAELELVVVVAAHAQICSTIFIMRTQRRYA